MESWRLVWRVGFVPVLSTRSIELLRDMLAGDDVRLTQGSTTTPPPLMCTQDWEVEAGDWLTICAVAECDGFGKATVGMCEEYWSRACFEADMRLGEPAGCRWLHNWFDDVPRDEMRRELLAEVELALSEREVKPDAVIEKGG